MPRVSRLAVLVVVLGTVFGSGSVVSAAEDSEIDVDSGSDEVEETESDDEGGQSEAENDDTEGGVVVPMVFPVAAEHGFINGWHFPRDGGARLHEGIDIMAERHSLLVAAVDGVIETVRHSNSGRAGNMVVLRGDDGNRFYYIHLNNDEPGTDNGANIAEQAFAPGIAVGTQVNAGDPIGFVGDSGNAENTAPHVHFGLKVAAGETINPYWSLTGADAEGQTTRAFGSLAVTGPRGWGYPAVGFVLLVGGALCLITSSRLSRYAQRPASSVC